jgi:predicted glycosyltransferase involved in capsule biosynthesis
MNSVAIIVPYREQHKQNRERELSVFTAHMKHMMDLLISEHRIKKYHIYVIEQSDGKKFNRGLLLNIGAHLANKTYDTLIFHDVDLIPENNLRYWYSDKPIKKQPIHIAGCWKDRYEGSSYFGGIVSFRREDFQTINGYPNSFWGWGGEDDSLRERCRLNGFRIEKVTEGKIYDMETDSNGLPMNLSQKLHLLKKHPEWKCENKWEQRYIDREIWDKNGLNQIKYQIDDWETIDSLTKVQVRI